MLVRFLLLALLTALVGNAHAQLLPPVSAAPAAGPVLSEPFTAADTLRAIRNLFKSKRTTGGWLAGGSAALTAVTGVGTLADNNGKNCGGYFCPDAFGSALLIGIGLAPAWVPGTVSLIRFNKKRERQALAYYEQNHQLSRQVGRNLSARFFNTNYRFSKRN